MCVWGVVVVVVCVCMCVCLLLVGVKIGRTDICVLFERDKRSEQYNVVGVRARVPFFVFSFFCGRTFNVEWCFKRRAVQQQIKPANATGRAALNIALMPNT